MMGAFVSGEQMQQLFQRMCRTDSRIKELYIKGVRYEASLVNPYLLAGGLSNLTKLGMARTSVTTAQVRLLFHRISFSTKLMYLDVSFLDLTEVSALTLASAIHKVEKMIMTECELTDLQIQAIFEPSNRLGQNLKFSGLKTTFLDLSLVFLGNIDTDLMARGVVEIQTVRMIECGLTKEEVESILLQVSDRTKIKKLEVSKEDLRDVCEQLIKKAKENNFQVVGCDEHESATFYDEDYWLSFHDN